MKTLYDSLSQNLIKVLFLDLGCGNGRHIKYLLDENIKLMD